MVQLKIPADIFEQMVNQAEADAPIEACGILAGTESVVQKLYKMTNTNQSNEHFMMSPEEQFAVVKEIRSAGLEMLAIYHSHPESPARPSEEDIRLAFTPNILHVIISVQVPDKPDVKAFKIEGGSVTAVPVKIMKG